ncbi:YgaP family membrane protein [Halorientalis halophila]|uniref:YgaP family membrane protein n=1 Tax=Halorientalis halophila TaxID=3108499 RepID=UPI003009FEDE
MDRNVGGVDRAVRIALGVLVAVAGAAAIGGYWRAGAAVGALILAIGAVLVITGTTQRCPIYAGAGIDTCETER